MLPACAVGEPSAAGLSTALRQLSLDGEQTYHVRDLHLTRGDIKFYLSEGILSFAKPVAGRTIAAAFTAYGIEAGDAEVITLPPRRSERASLANYIKSPNLDEHFSSAAFFFSDETASELRSQITEPALHKAPQSLTELQRIADPVLHRLSRAVELRLLESLLDRHPPERGFFFSVIAGRELGTFQALYDPDLFEPVSIGRTRESPNEGGFQLWTSFRPRRAAPFVLPPSVISDYKIDGTIDSALKLSARAVFHYEANDSDGRALRFELSDRLRVTSAQIDGRPAEVFQGQVETPAGREEAGGAFLLVADEPVGAGRHTVEVAYGGSVIRQTANRTYFVDDRTTWFPHVGAMRTVFDLTFHCPESLRLVSTGEPMGDGVSNGTRTVHRRSAYPEALAGFNLGDFQLKINQAGPYRVESYANRTESSQEGVIAAEAAGILEYYTRLWQPLPARTLAVSPIPGYFGQGFPGLIYLSTISFIREEDRPAALRDPRMISFFSQMLLPHEIAHQWWGNLVVPADYRTDWLAEAMASYSALSYLEAQDGKGVVSSTLQQYREDLLKTKDGKPVDEDGPIDFGSRLIDAAGAGAWHTITYEKGAWILRMLHQRLGDDRFREMQQALIQQFGTRAISNEDLRRVIASYLPAGQPDRDLSLFFETWIYNTGIPHLALQHGPEGWNLVVTGVDESFTADIPLACQGRGKTAEVVWIRASTGSNPLVKAGKSAICRLPDESRFLYRN
jgi:hypothetical protein